MSAPLDLAVADDAMQAAHAILLQLRERIARELRDYPYPIAGCDEAFKLLSLQRECCRVAIGGLASLDGLTRADAAEALRQLTATPVPLAASEIAALDLAASRAGPAA